MDWQENLLPDEMPPAWMWPFDEELSVWFEDVERNRRERYGTPADNEGNETTPMMGNEFSQGRGRHG